MTNVFFQKYFYGLDFNLIIKKIIQTIGKFKLGCYFCITNYQNQFKNMKLMTKKNVFSTTFVALFSSLLLSCDNSSNDPHSEYSDKIESVTLLKTTKSWDGTLYPSYPTTQPEISVLKIAVPPNSALNWHKHSVINAAYVEKGEIQIERKEDGKTQWVRKGQVLPEMVNVGHRGKTGDQGATLIVFYSGTPDIPLSEPVK